MTLDNFNAVTEHVNVECEVDGVRLVGFLVDDGARHWVWARDERDAITLVAEALMGDGCSIDKYLSDVGLSMDEVYVMPLVEDMLVGIRFVDEDGNKYPMIDAFKANRCRGVVASSEY